VSQDDRGNDVDTEAKVARVPEEVVELGQRRDARIAEPKVEAARLVGKLDEQDAGARCRGRRPSDSSAKTRFYQAVCEAKLASIIRVDLKSERFSYDIRELRSHVRNSWMASSSS